MKHINQSWVRLGKNLTTLIVVVTIALFFYVYQPKTQYSPVLQQSDSTITDNVPRNNIAKYDTTINPNSATFENLIRVGFSEKQAKSCIKYREKGGRFYKKDDLKKIYSITDEDFLRISPFIVIPTKEIKTQCSRKELRVENKVKSKEVTLININICDTTELQKLPGIGSYRAKKIIEYRDKCGGFYSIGQFYSIYSMDSATIKKIQDKVIFDISQIKKININTASFKEINKHPFISYEQTKNILNYKKIVGQINSIEELSENNIITNEEFEKMKFYIKTID
ncbi:MAG: helix-hairpin-helix domain-containing protein [Bacteroidales bacterium]|nr:helix-hairpin-helix domain-containing protein [Bacteroidales bacterium]